MSANANTVSPEEFVRTWQAASSVKEVCEKLNLTDNGARNRAHGYREKGVPLKKMPHTGRKPLDYKALAALAESLAPGKAS